MLTEELKNRVREAQEQAFNHGNMKPMNEFCSRDLIDHSTFRDPRAVPGLEGLTQRIALLRAAFPDIHIVIDNMLGEGDQVAYHWRVTGTFQGPLRGLEPTGEAVDFTGINIERFSNGLIAEHWSSVDRLTMMQQMGVLPSVQGAGR